MKVSRLPTIKPNTMQKINYGYVRSAAKQNKYNRGQIISHVNSTHGGNKSHSPSRVGKGKIVENKYNGVILNTEHDYVGIGAEFEFAREINDFAR